MPELGIEISGQESKALDRYLDQRARQSDSGVRPGLPNLFGAWERVHWSLALY